MQTQEIAQAAMHSPDWLTIITSAAAVIVAAFGAVLMTLYWEKRREKRAEKLRLFLTLMMHRKARPPNQDWVNALNVIHVVFYDAPKVLKAWRDLYPILQADKPYSEEGVHAYINMLSEMARAVNYPNLQQIDIDKFYSPAVYAQQAEMNAQMQGAMMGFLRGAASIIPEKQGDSVKPGLEIGILIPEEGNRVVRKVDVIGYVYPSVVNVQILISSPNGLWYPQGPVHRDGAKWKVPATVGDEKSAGLSFKLVAIVSATQVTKPVKELPPDAISSRPVTVTRSAEIRA